MAGPTQNGVLQKDDNAYPVMGGTSSSDNNTVINSAFDPVTRRLLVDITGGGAGTWYDVTGTIDGSNVTFTIAVAAGSDFLLFLARQPQMLTTDFTYSVGASTTTITYTGAPDASLSGQPHKAFVIS